MGNWPLIELVCSERGYTFSLQVQHPAAKMLVMASHMQEQEVGDGTNFVLVFAGVLLEVAEELLRMGLSVSQVIEFDISPFQCLCALPYTDCAFYLNGLHSIENKITNFTVCVLFLSLQLIEGYEKACKKALEILPDCVCSSAKNLHDVKEAASYIRTAVASKQYGNEDFLANLIAQACGELILQIVLAVGLDLKKRSFCAIEIVSLSLKCPFLRTLAVSTLIMSEFAKYW